MKNFDNQSIQIVKIASYVAMYVCCASINNFIFTQLKIVTVATIDMTCYTYMYINPTDFSIPSDGDITQQELNNYKLQFQKILDA